MSLLDDVSIVVTPNGYKAGTLYGAIPVPTEGSELIINGDFDTDSDWNKGSGWTISGGKASLNNNSGSLSKSDGVLQVGKRYLFSIEITDISLGAFSPKTNAGQNIFDSVTINTVGVHTSIFTVTSGVNLQIRASGTTTGSIDNVSLKEYTSADMDVTRATDATRVNESGLIADVLSNVPRIDYTGGGCPHILAEPQRTNLVTYSENFSESGYGWNYTSDALELIELNSIVSPDGTQNADKIAKTATRVYANAHSPQNIVSNQLYSWSMFIKEGTHSIGYLSLTQGDTEYKSYFDLNNETSGMLSGSATTKLEDFGNGWYKCTLSNISSTTDLSVRFDFGMSYSTTNANWPSASEGNGLYMYYWGAQLEESYATSYIPTSGSTVTRNQDIFTRDGIGSLINDSEGVLFAEVSALSDDLTLRAICLSDGTLSNRIIILYSNDLSGFRAVVVANGVNTVIINVTINVTNTNKIAFKYKQNDTALWINGVEVGTSFLATMPTGINKLSFDRGDGVSPLFGKVKQLQVYTTALTDAQLTSLTS